MKNAELDLAGKYNIAVPRYTSYPAMPHWETSAFAADTWKGSVITSFKESNKASGISLYIHLPFCESLCTYCGCNTRITKNHGVEVPYIKAVLAEWKMYRKMLNERPVISEVHLGGGTPTFFSPANLELLMEGLLQDADMHPDAEFSFEAHPGNTTSEHLQSLYNRGFRRLSLGIQDFDPRVQLIINRVQTVEQVEQVTAEARRIGYNSINYDLIYGLPLQTLEGLAETMHQVAVFRPDRIAFYSYAHVPWVKPGQRKFTEVDLPDTALKNKLHETGRGLLIYYGYKEIGMDHFALPGDKLLEAEHSGKLHRNFMGYTHQHTQLMIGLGVSSISDSWYAFAQNVKNVEEYLSIIKEGRLPLIKGHILTNEDRVIRRHILNIMCRGYTPWGDTTNTSIAKQDISERLLPLEEDGLVSIETGGVRVLAEGKRFLRNICRCFDARLWREVSKEQVFSMAV
ncbi:MAG TPA: oxygen-independent coproporphyrinogen III oxidase [Mucilaginibacter sp.]|nr:oxygen-independent coproporphyrinogen III oxidase [Mucilaginibacter sp.]